MSLPNVLLSLLREPMSGSELTELFGSSIGHFWSADLSQIYRALDSLEQRGCVKSKSVPSPRGPARRVYSLTAPGKRHLLEWVRSEPQLPAVKFEYLAKLFSVPADTDPIGSARAQLGALRDQAATGLAVLEGIDATMSELDGYPARLPTSVFYPWLTLRHGLFRRRALVEWIDESLAWLDRRGKDEADDDLAGNAELIRILRGSVEPKTSRSS